MQTLPPLAQDVIKLISAASKITGITKTFLISRERSKFSEPTRHAIYACLKHQGHKINDIAEAFQRTRAQILYGIESHQELHKKSEEHRALFKQIKDALK